MTFQLPFFRNVLEELSSNVILEVTRNSKVKVRILLSSIPLPNTSHEFQNFKIVDGSAHGSYSRNQRVNGHHEVVKSFSPSWFGTTALISNVPFAIEQNKINPLRSRRRVFRVSSHEMPDTLQQAPFLFSVTNTNGGYQIMMAGIGRMSNFNGQCDAHSSTSQIALL